MTIAQNADSDGDISSTIRHQISMPIGSTKCRPALTAGQVSSGFGWSMSMSGGRSGLFDAAHTENRYSASTIAPTTHGVASPSTRFAASSTQYSTPITMIVPEMPRPVRINAAVQERGSRRISGCMPSFSASRCTM